MGSKTPDERKKQNRNRGILVVVLLIVFVAGGSWLLLQPDQKGDGAQPANTPAAPAAAAGAEDGAMAAANTQTDEPIGVNQEKIVALAKQEYADWNGNRSKYGADGEWCGDFAAWVLNTATGIPKPNNYSVADAWKGVTGKLSYHPGRDGMEPGDFVLYDVDTTNTPGSGGAAHNGTANHINIYVGDGNVIGGNQSGAVTERNLDDYLVNLTPDLKKGDAGYADYTFYVLGYIRVSD